jgi:hypothetical protein
VIERASSPTTSLDRLTRLTRVFNLVRFSIIPASSLVRSSRRNGPRLDNLSGRSSVTLHTSHRHNTLRALLSIITATTPSSLPAQCHRAAVNSRNNGGRLLRRSPGRTANTSMTRPSGRLRQATHPTEPCGTCRRPVPVPFRLAIRAPILNHNTTHLPALAEPTMKRHIIPTCVNPRNKTWGMQMRDDSKGRRERCHDHLRRGPMSMRL